MISNIVNTEHQNRFQVDDLLPIRHYVQMCVYYINNIYLLYIIHL